MAVVLCHRSPALDSMWRSRPHHNTDHNPAGYSWEPYRTARRRPAPLAVWKHRLESVCHKAEERPAEAGHYEHHKLQYVWSQIMQ